MKLPIKGLLGCSLALSAIASFAQPSIAQNRNQYFCGTSNGQPTTFVRTARGIIPLIRWTNKSFRDPWTPVRRCEEVSNRFQRFYNNGTLKYIRAGKLNRQPVLCVAGYKGGACLPNGLLVTLKPGTNPHNTLKSMLDLRALAAGQAIELRGSDGTAVDLFEEVNGATYFNLELLDRAEVESSPEPGDITREEILGN